DPGVDVVSLTASVGSVTKNDDGAWSWSWAPVDGPDDSQTVTITATDSDGDSSQTTFVLTVNNVAPSITVSGASSIAEGSVYTLTLGTIADPGLDTVTGWI